MSNGNGLTVNAGKLLLAFGLGVGAAVAGTFTTFETQSAHDRDQQRVEEMLQEIRGDVKTLLEKRGEYRRVDPWKATPSSPADPKMPDQKS